LLSAANFVPPGPKQGLASFQGVFLPKFKKIFVEITNSCNLSCTFCPPAPRPQGFMAPTEFAEILRRIDGHTDHLCLHLLGEPLLHPDLAALLGICHQQRMQVNLTSNGTMLGRCRESLLRSPALRQLNISLHSCADSEAGSASYLDEVLAFIQAAATTSLLVNLRLWNLDATAGAAVHSRNGTILRRLEHYFALSSPVAERMTPGQGVALAPGVFLSQDVAFVWPHHQRGELGSRGRCRGLRDHVGILVDGTVVPCCLDAAGDIPLGNIHQQPLAEILATPRTLAMRDGLARGELVEPLCRRCNYRQRFN